MTSDVTAESGYRVQDPMSGEVLERHDTATDDDVEAAMAGAQSAFLSWREKTIEERATVVRRVAALFSERRTELVATISQEMGKPASEGEEEVDFCTAIFTYFADHGAELTADQEIATSGGGRARIERLPIGPLLGIMPWNFPYYQVARFAAPNLVLGNTIILKHAEICPRSALAIQQIMDDAGVPDGVYGTVFASFDQIAEVIADPRVQGVSLTGSERAGSVVGALAGKHLKKAVLELGGSDPYVVLDSEDPGAAATTAWQTRMYNTGQACNSNKRLIVMDDVYDEFTDRLVELARSMTPGRPDDGGESTYTPMSSRTAAETLDEQVKQAVRDGATLHVGGELADDGSAYFSPAVLTGVTSDMAAYREELFGPVAVVYKVSSDDEAVELANDTPYGLGGAVFATDTHRAQRVARRLDVGMANVNTPGGEGAELPFGGVKRSGFGRELGPLGMEEFVNKRMYFIAD